jgi:hypothetical protein
MNAITVQPSTVEELAGDVDRAIDFAIASMTQPEAEAQREAFVDLMGTLRNLKIELRDLVLRPLPMPIDRIEPAGGRR